MAAVKRTPPTEERAPGPVSAPLPQPESDEAFRKAREARVEASERGLEAMNAALDRAAKNLEKLQPVAPPPAPPAHPKATYQVWPHGTLQHNGKTYAPGDTLVMFVAEAERVPCLVKVDG